MGDVISRGSCPRLPADLRKAAKAALIDEYQRAAAELAAARELLAAIVQCADVATPAHAQDMNTYQQVQADRLAAIKVYGRIALDSGRFGNMTKLTLDTALKPLPYERYIEPDDVAGDAMPPPVRQRSASGG